MQKLFNNVFMGERFFLLLWVVPIVIPIQICRADMIQAKNALPEDTHLIQDLENYLQVLKKWWAYCMQATRWTQLYSWKLNIQTFLSISSYLWFLPLLLGVAGFKWPYLGWNSERRENALFQGLTKNVSNFDAQFKKIRIKLVLVGCSLLHAEESGRKWGAVAFYGDLDGSIHERKNTNRK